MGGHMRSHLAKLPLPPKHENSAQTESAQTLSPSSSTSLNFHHRNNMMQSYRSINGGELSTEEATFHGESDTDSRPKNASRRRSKRPRKIETEPVKFSAEEVAMWLLKLSKDKWTKGKQKVRQKVETDKEEDDAEEEEKEDYSVSKICKKSHSQTKFRCETCRKVFPSYQALGGHRASHKKIRNNDEDDLEDDNDNFVVDEKVFECPFCFKVFDSGQALGGHKKVHLSNLGNGNANARSSARNKLIDLNLPAPVDEDEVISIVSNAASVVV
ncbi:zinc finger protein zat9 [Quercus suber]|uniref:Zinc finger protein zat9 n=2 Tax=Quercus suber TaxID=58331 RepID=A0AAW0LKP6_QUESU